MSIDDVTRSFASSLAFAKNNTIDLSKSGSKNKATQSFLLARPLTRKPPTLAALRSFFRDVWLLEGKFSIQSCEDNLFLISFDHKKDRGKVIWGGPWNFHHAPVVLQEYDGVASLDEVPMTLLYFWVQIRKIPPLYSTKPMIKDIAPVAGKYIDTDHRLFKNTKKARVFVSHDIAQPFVLKKMVQLDVNVEKELVFVYENMTPICENCNLIFHVEDHCPLIGKQATKAPVFGRIPSLQGPPPGFGPLMEPNFRFQGKVLNPRAPSFMPSPQVNKVRRPIVLKKRLFQSEDESETEDSPLAIESVAGSSSSAASPSQNLCLDMVRLDLSELEIEASEAEGSLVPSEALSGLGKGKGDSDTVLSSAEQPVLDLAEPMEACVKQATTVVARNKRQERPSPIQSPVKLLLPLPSLFQTQFDDVPLKKLKTPQFSSVFNARSLNLVAAAGNILVPKERAGRGNVGKKKEVGTASKRTRATKKKAEGAVPKKRGRPFGSKNKNPPKEKAEEEKKKVHTVESIFGAIAKPLSPSDKGKEKL